VLITDMHISGADCTQKPATYIDRAALPEGNRTSAT